MKKVILSDLNKHYCRFTGCTRSTAGYVGVHKMRLSKQKIHATAPSAFLKTQMTTLITFLSTNITAPTINIFEEPVKVG